MKINTKVKILGYSFLIGTALSACKKNETLESSLLKNNGKNLASASDGKWDLLGYGYDATGEYANSSAGKFKVINIELLKSTFPSRVEEDKSSTKTQEIISGENAVTYLDSLTNKFDNTLTVPDKNNEKTPMFTLTVSNNYGGADAFSSKYVYSSYFLKLQQKRVKLNADIQLLRSYLDADFAYDLQTKTAQYIVQQYGTHVLTDIVLGAKLSALYRGETSKTDRRSAATTGVKFNILGIFGIDTRTSSGSQEINENTNQWLSFKAIGGEPSASLFGTLQTNVISSPPISTTAWENSSTIENAELIDISTNGMIPIYDLIADQSKSTEVKAYVATYITSKRPVLQVSAPANGTFMRNESTGQVYIVMDGKLRYIQNQSILYGLFEFKESMLSHYSAAQMATYPMGTPISPSNGLINNSPSGIVYFRELNVLRRIPNMTIKERYHFNWNIIQNVNSIAGYTIGGDMTM
ncbi:MAC/perforin domain-containing protein [Pedobacter sp. AW1-32]|uniref:MAC/perforin domain-containing protein n=1 Tax=Pedobacter sp. AW1-32 TaxID=3383026 RepID=UPI003FEEA88E